MIRLIWIAAFLAWVGSAAGQSVFLFGDGFEPAPPVSRQIVVSPASVLLTGAAQEQQLTARITDLSGQPLAQTAQWRSSNPDAVSVSPDGLLTAGVAVGSAQIFASTEGALDALAMVVVATPAAGAILVEDSQVVMGPVAVDNMAPFAPGFQVTARISGLPVPAPGDMIIGAGELPIGGRVVSASQAANGVDVVLEIVPLSDLFDQLDISQQIKLSRLAMTPNPQVEGLYDIQVFTDGGIRLELKSQARKGVLGTSALFDFDRDCTSTPAMLTDILNVNVGPSIDLNPDINFDIVHSSTGFERLVINGSLGAVFEIKPRFQANFGGKVTCEVEVGSFPIPFGGPFSALLNGQVGVGPGFELAGSVTLVEQVGYDLTVSASSEFAAGIDCETDPECEMVGDLELNADGTLRPVLPDLGGLAGSARLQANGRGFLFAKVGLGTFFSALAFKPLSITGGLRAGVDLESALSQANKPDYASDFKLELVGTAGASTDITQLFQLIGINPPSLTLEIANTLSESPKGMLVITDPNGGTSLGSSNPSVQAGSDSQPGELATFTISLSSSTFLTDYAVDRIEIFERKPDGNGGFLLEPGRPGCNTFVPMPGQTQFTCQTDFLESGTRTFHAFVRSNLFDVPIALSLELGNQTATSVDVEPLDENLYTAIAEAGDVAAGPEIDENSSPQFASASASAAGASASATAGNFRLTGEASSVAPPPGSPHIQADTRSRFSGVIRLPTDSEQSQALSLRVTGNISVGSEPANSAQVVLSVSAGNGYCDPDPDSLCNGQSSIDGSGTAESGVLNGFQQGSVTMPLGDVPPGPAGVSLDIEFSVGALDGGCGGAMAEILLDGAAPTGSATSGRKQSLVPLGC